MEHKHARFSHDHDLDDGLATGSAAHGKVSGTGVPMHTFHNLFHASIQCDCGYHAEIDTYGEQGLWWKWLVHVHAHEGHEFTIRGTSSRPPTILN